MLLFEKDKRILHNIQYILETTVCVHSCKCTPLIQSIHELNEHEMHIVRLQRKFDIVDKTIFEN